MEKLKNEANGSKEGQRLVKVLSALPISQGQLDEVAKGIVAYDNRNGKDSDTLSIQSECLAVDGHHT